MKELRDTGTRGQALQYAIIGIAAAFPSASSESKRMLVVAGLAGTVAYIIFDIYASKDLYEFVLQLSYLGSMIGMGVGLLSVQYFAQNLKSDRAKNILYFTASLIGAIGGFMLSVKYSFIHFNIEYRKIFPIHSLLFKEANV